MPAKTTSKPTAAKRKSKATVTKLDGARMVEAPSIQRAPTHDEIAFRAFELYQLRAPADGGALNDWLAAERELRAS